MIVECYVWWTSSDIFKPYSLWLGTRYIVFSSCYTCARFLRSTNKKIKSVKVPYVKSMYGLLCFQNNNSVSQHTYLQDGGLVSGISLSRGLTGDTDMEESRSDITDVTDITGGTVWHIALCPLSATLILFVYLHDGGQVSGISLSRGICPLSVTLILYVYLHDGGLVSGISLSSGICLH